MTQLFRPLPCLVLLAVLAGSWSSALAKSHQQGHHQKIEAASSARQEKATLKKDEKKKSAERVAKKRHKEPVRDEKPVEHAPELTGDLAVVKDVIDLARRGKTSDATDAAKTIGDPAAQKLAEWFILRHSESQANFSRYAAFIAANPDWPGAALMRRRAESRLWQEQSDAATVHAFTSDQPVTARGRF